ncbi:NAD-dependent dehydratase [Sinomonas cellulolyticus]|uniref:NAD(P)-dependent oxidoreductase n=1 Tax=Sinomonas cellulolyticus TaxID=2801916 RepID=A0ABS1JZN4_9MICC|nr:MULTISPECIES: NAD(P)-dependent oxidoreductase [Sinomonas]MBL0704582.1 NAD(P)-dependent oxidoreductase [Sinomonas cellulolyticus]GHG49464.1 NAD-dependent dehydratase [Sinomonas sp. KCTC 49339]
MTETTHVARGRIVLTGAAGSLARDIIPYLRDRGYEVLCLDQAEPADPMGCEWVIASIQDRDRLREAFAGCAAVVHLAGIPLEASWEEIARTNIDGTESVLEAARAVGVPKAVLASSIHAAGFTPVPHRGETLPDDVPARPNTFYGVSKAAVEALGSLYADRHGMDVVCLRIASRFSTPQNERMLSTWLSPADAGRLFDAALSNAAGGFRIVWGVSRNTRSYFSREGGRSIGFHPEDDAEAYAHDLPADAAGAAQGSEWDQRCIGGVFCSPEPPMFSRQA